MIYTSYSIIGINNPSTYTSIFKINNVILSGIYNAILNLFHIFSNLCLIYYYKYYFFDYMMKSIDI